MAGWHGKNSGCTMDDGSDAHSRLDFCPKLGCQSRWYLSIRQDATAHVMEPLAPSGGTGGSQQDLWDPSGDDSWHSIDPRGTPWG